MTMPINLGTERPLSFHQACRLVLNRRSQKPFTPATLYRWHFGGIAGYDGKLVHLEATKVSGYLMTTYEALVRFAEALHPMYRMLPYPTGGPKPKRQEAIV
jgi:hypothetical protein